MTHTPTIVLLCCLAHAAFGMPRYRYTRNGGMRFLRVGRVQMSWCVCRNSI